MEYLTWGGGPKSLLFIQGGPGSVLPGGLTGRMIRRRFASFVHAGYTSSIVTRRRHMPPGHTVADMAEDYAQVVDERFGGRVDLVVGESFGGLIAQYLAARHPEQVDRLALVASGHRVSRWGKDVDSALTAAIVRGDRAGAATAFAEYLLPGREPRGLRRLLGPLLLRRAVTDDRLPREDLLVEAEAEMSADSRPVLPDLTAPVLLVAGDRDRFFPRDVVAETARLIPRCTLVRHAGAGHVRTATSTRVPHEVLAFVHDRTGAERQGADRSHRVVRSPRGARPLLGLRRRPGRLAVLLFRLPLAAYRHDAGPAMGHTFMAFTHIGRRTGQPHQAVAMMVRYVESTGEAVICAAWGPRTDWYRNLRERPATRVQLGGRTFTPQQRFLTEDEAFEAAAQLRREHPHRVRLLSALLGWGDLRDDARLRDFVRDHPFVAFRPAAVQAVDDGRGGRSPERTPVPQEAAPGVHVLTLGRGALASNVCLVRSGQAWVLVDAGWPGSAATIRGAAESLFGTGARPAAILLTHIHPDHSGAAGELARAWDVPVYAHADELPMAPARYLPEYGMPLDRWVVVPLLRLLPAAVRARIEAAGDISDVTRPLDPASGVPGLLDWEVVPTPGHTPGHVAYLRPRDGVLISGDAVATVDLNSLRGVLTARRHLGGPPRYTTWDPALAQRSIAALAGREPRVLVPGHGRPLSAGTADGLRTLVGQGTGRPVEFTC
jgi:deazaflavin-dependent oxidoreductase (nitroreductase family)